MEAPVMQNWRNLGFAEAPCRHVETRPLPLYRVWGPRTAFDGRETGTEWETGFFSLEKPRSVLDAELRGNIVNYDNRVCFVSTFELASGSPYWTGPVAHGPDDLSRPLTQVYLEGNWKSNVKLVTSREVLRHDVFVVFPPAPPGVKDENDKRLYRQ